MCAFTFTVFVSAFMLFPTAPFHIISLGGSKFTAGLFLALLTFASAASAPFTGALSDRLGKRPTLIGCSLVLCLLSAGYAAAPSTALLLAIVPVHGLFWSGLLSASAAYLLGLVPESRRAEGVAYWGLSTVAAIAVAPAMAFWIYERGGWSSLCMLAFLLNLLMAEIARRLERDETKAPDHASEGFIEWRVLLVSVTVLLFSFGYGGITSFVALYAEANGVAAKGAYFTAMASVILVTRPLLGRLADRIGHRKVFLPCLVLTTAGIALLTVGGTFGWLITSAIVFGLGFGASFPVFTAHIMKHVAANRRGAAFGSMLAAFDTGIGSGSMALGFLIERSGYRPAFAVAAGLAALALPYFLVVEPRLLAEAPKTLG